MSDQAEASSSSTPEALPSKLPKAVLPLASLCESDPESRLSVVQIRREPDGTAVAMGSDGRIAAVVRWQPEHWDRVSDVQTIPRAAIAAMMGHFEKSLESDPTMRLPLIHSTVLAPQGDAFYIHLNARSLSRLCKFFIATCGKDVQLRIGITSGKSMVVMTPLEQDDADATVEVTAAIMPIDPCRKVTGAQLLSPAQSKACRDAVFCALGRISGSADLAHHMAHTQMMELLFFAAEKLGETGIRKTVDAAWRRLDHPAQLVAARAKLDLIYKLVRPGMFDDDVQAMSAEDRLKSISEILDMGDERAVARLQASEAKTS